MTDNPAARQMLGYLFTRGGVHAYAYGLALQQLTGVEMKKMLPIPKIEDVQLPESKKFMAEGWHRRLYRFSPGDYKEVASIWNGEHFDGSGPLEVVTARRKAAMSTTTRASPRRSRPIRPQGDLRDRAEALPAGPVSDPPLFQRASPEAAPSGFFNVAQTGIGD